MPALNAKRFWLLVAIGCVILLLHSFLPLLTPGRLLALSLYGIAEWSWGYYKGKEAAKAEFAKQNDKI